MPTIGRTANGGIGQNPTPPVRHGGQIVGLPRTFPRIAEKVHIQVRLIARCSDEVKKSTGKAAKPPRPARPGTGRNRTMTRSTAINGPEADPTAAAMERMELYCAANPGSPTAIRRPRLMMRAQLWIALLGLSVEEGIVGIGNTVEGALRAFDAQYLAGLRPPSEIHGHRALERRQLSAA